MRNKDINFKKSYSKEVFSLEGKKIFSTFLFLSFLLLIFFFLFVSCQNGFCTKKIGSILDNGITGKVIDSSGDFNSIEKVGIISPNDLEEKDRFSNSISVYGDYLAIGNPYDDDKGTNSGSVYIYKKDSSGEWKYYQKIYGSQISSNSFFGEAISIYGNVLVIGSYGEKTFAGAVYFFELDSSNQWVETKRVGLSNSEYSFFGESVSVFEDRVAIGCPECSVKTGTFTSKDIGSIFVYKKNLGEWILEKKLNGSKEDSSFGKVVLLTKDFLFSSAVNSQENGVVYSFESFGWNFKEKLFSSSSFAGGFGESLSFYEDSLFIGSPLENSGSSFRLDYLDDWNFGAITDFSLAKEIAYKYNRPLLIVTSMPNCPHANSFNVAIGNSQELINYAKENKIVLFLKLEDPYVFRSELFGVLDSYRDISPTAGTFSAIFKVKKYSNSNSFLDSFGSELEFLQISSGPYSGELSFFNYMFPSPDSTRINGILVDQEKDSSDRITLTPNNYISILNSYFPNQYFKSLMIGDGNNGGSVYVYKKDASGNWKAQQKIVPNRVTSKDNFGVSLSVYGDYLVAGSSNFGIKNVNQGAFYLYKKSPSGVWEYINEVSLPNGQIGDYFGKSIAIQNDSIFVGVDNLEGGNFKGGALNYKLFYQEFDTTAPVLTLLNYSGFATSGVSLQILANDDKGISNWRINPTSSFLISQNGLITNKTSLSAGEYTLDVFVNDSSNNIASGKVTIEIKAPFCGDGFCKGEENCSNCQNDCGGCLVSPFLYADDSVEDYFVSWEEISFGSLVSLQIDQSLSFSFFEEEYSFSLVSFDNLKLKLNLYHLENLVKTFDVESGKNYSLDLDADNLEDLTLVYGSSSGETAYFTLKEFVEESSDENEDVDEDSILNIEETTGDEEEVASSEGSSQEDSNLHEEDSSTTDSFEVNPSTQRVSNKDDEDPSNFSNTKIWLIIIIIFCFIFLLLVLYFVFFKGNDSKNNLQKESVNDFNSPPNRGFSPRFPQRKFFPPVNSPRINKLNIKRKF